MTFEKQLEKIEGIAKELQNPETDLNKAVELYEEGIKLVKEAEKELSKIERRVEIVTSQPGSDEIIADPYN